MTPLLKELDAIIKKIDNASSSGEIPNDEIMYLAGVLTGAGIGLGKKYNKSAFSEALDKVTKS